METTAVEEVLTLIDEWLTLTLERTLFSSDDCRDRLLDLRVAATNERIPVLA